MNRFVGGASALWFCLWLLVPGVAGDDRAKVVSPASLNVPNVDVTDQDGRRLKFYDDLIKGKTVAMNFIFTSCPTVCPPMGANFGALQQRLKQSQVSEVSLISVSIDPVTDTPARLKQWRSRFKGEAGWHLVTGRKQDIDKLLKMLRVFAPDINTHAPFVIIGTDGGRDGWRFVNGLTAAEKLAEMLTESSGVRKPAVAPSAKPDASDQERGATQPDTTEGRLGAAARYFGDTPLVDQHGREHRFYSDLIRGRVIVINTFFTSCTSVCPATMGSLAKVQDWLGDRLGREVFILSISVDPRNDTPERLAAYARDIQTRAGWYLLTGERENVSQVLQKIGQFTENRDSHSNVFIIGNDPTGLWKKALGLAPVTEIIPIVASVVEDRG
ncbi:SCO family protein [Sulfidibacter corallicola]|uniref:SCO family protein n=1 Tax=Sulfidibacter corallicola TaxID=2818388 RepID=A0A8A4TMS4_SULCO|nr:SCO family protein [Sulfidibacter corallicola]QTD50853.1 SCO family protein [Sulfidibacter corallicola]